jgi:hypothetical protein
MRPKKQVRIQLKSGCGFWDRPTRYSPGDREKVFDRRVGPVIDSNHVRDAFDGPVCGSDN